MGRAIIRAGGGVFQKLLITHQKVFFLREIKRTCEHARISTRSGLVPFVLLACSGCYAESLDATSRSNTSVAITESREIPAKILNDQAEMQKNLSSEEMDCGLSGNPLVFNVKHDPSVTLEVLDCLEGARSNKTSWKAFLLAVDRWRSNGRECVAAKAFTIALNNRSLSTISSYGLKPAKHSQAQMYFTVRYPSLGLDEAIRVFFDRDARGHPSGFANFLSKCREFAEPEAGARATRIRNYLTDVQEER